MANPLRSKFVFPSIKAVTETASGIERALAEELQKLDQLLGRNKDAEFQRKLIALVDEYEVDSKTIIAALENEPSSN